MIMIKNKKLIICLMLGIFLISLASAYSPHKQNTDWNVVISSNNATGCNVSYISYPNNSMAYLNGIMTQDGSSFNYLIDSGNLTQLGDTCVGIVCTDGINLEDGSVCKGVTQTGKELTTSKAISYFVIFIISILVFVGLLLLGFYIPAGNKRDELTGYILAISNLKYLKYVMFGFSYITLVWLSYFSWMIVYAYLDFNFLSNIFRFMFTFLVAITLPLFILFCFITIANLIKDSEIGKSLSYGLKIK